MMNFKYFSLFLLVINLPLQVVFSEKLPPADLSILKLQSFDGFKDLYLTTYEANGDLATKTSDAGNEEVEVGVSKEQKKMNDLVTARVKERPSEEKYSEDDILDSKKGGIVLEGNYGNEFTEVSETSNAKKRLFDFEKETLLWEKDLKERLSRSDIFTNGSAKDSPFDLVEDLNRIDTILFGEKADFFPKAAFANPKFDNSRNFRDESRSSGSGLGENGPDRKTKKSLKGEQLYVSQEKPNSIQKSWQSGATQNLPCTGEVKIQTVESMLKADDFLCSKTGFLKKGSGKSEGANINQCGSRGQIFKKPTDEGGSFGVLVFKEGLSRNNFKSYPVRFERLWQLNKKQGSYCKFYSWSKNAWGDLFVPVSRFYGNIDKAGGLVGGEPLLSLNNYSISPAASFIGGGLGVGISPGHLPFSLPATIPAPRSYPVNPSDYSIGDNSIAGNLAGLKPAFDQMNQYSLMAECTSKRFFQPTFIRNEFDLEKIGKLKFQYVSKRPLSKVRTEIEKSQDSQVGDLFQSLEDNLLREESCENKLGKNAGVKNINAAINSCEEVKKRGQENQQKGLDNMTKLVTKKREMRGLVTSIDNLTYDMETWLENTTQFEALMQRVAKKPKKY